MPRESKTGSPWRRLRPPPLGDDRLESASPRSGSPSPHRRSSSATPMLGAGTKRASISSGSASRSWAGRPAAGRHRPRWDLRRGGRFRCLTKLGHGWAGLLERLEQGHVSARKATSSSSSGAGSSRPARSSPRPCSTTGEGDRAPSRVRARGLRRRRGVHLLRTPREDARRRQGRPPRGAEPKRARAREGGRRPDRHALRRRHLQHERLRPRRP